MSILYIFMVARVIVASVHVTTPIAAVCLEMEGDVIKAIHPSMRGRCELFVWHTCISLPFRPNGYSIFLLRRQDMLEEYII